MMIFHYLIKRFKSKLETWSVVIYYTLAGYIGICLYVHTFCSFVRSHSNGVTALQTSFRNRLSRNLTHVFTNIISCTSSNMVNTGYL